MTASSTATAPQIDGSFVCVVDRQNVPLAAVISSYFGAPGKYFPLFTFPGVEHADRGQEFGDDEFIAKMVGTEAATKLTNLLARLDAKGYLILAGLSEAQKSYLAFRNGLTVIEVRDIAEARDKLERIGIRKETTVRSKAAQAHLGLYRALTSGSAVEIDERADDLPEASTNLNGLIIVEATSEHAGSIVAINYAHSVGASIKLVPQLKRKDARRIQNFVQFWKEYGVSEARDDLFSEIDTRLGSFAFDGYEFVTFFTEGLPYTLRGNVPGLCTYVDLANSPDRFIVNNILAETDDQLPSSIVFTIDDFINNGEAKAVARRLDQADFYVRPLAGMGATGFSFGYHAEHFPFGVFHIVSHGGEIDGNAVTQQFTDRKGATHTLEYDEVIGLHRVLTESDRIAVQRKVIFKAIDGIAWDDEERKGKLPHYVYEDMRKQILSSSKNWHKNASRKPLTNVVGSTHVRCNDGIHQAMFRTVGGYGTPIIFNNACWSWWGVAEFFVSSGARAYLGTLWAVEDSVAVTAADAFYEYALDGTIAAGVREANRAIENTDYAGIYALWGLHFSTLSKGKSIEASMHAVCDRIAMQLNMYGKFLEGGVAEDDVRDSAIEALELLDQDFDALCEGPGVERLRAKVARTLRKVGPRKPSEKRPDQ